MNTWKTWDALINEAIEDRAEEFRQQMSTLDARTFVAEYKTVSLALPRQMGKSRYIRDRAKCGDLIIVPNAAVRTNYTARGIMAFPACALDDIANHVKNVFKPMTVWVDEPDLCQSRLQSILDIIITDPEQRVIMLGTRR